MFVSKSLQGTFLHIPDSVTMWKRSTTSSYLRKSQPPNTITVVISMGIWRPRVIDVLKQRTSTLQCTQSSREMIGHWVPTSERGRTDGREVVYWNSRRLVLLLPMPSVSLSILGSWSSRYSEDESKDRRSWDSVPGLGRLSWTFYVLSCTDKSPVLNRDLLNYVSPCISVVHSR